MEKWIRIFLKGYIILDMPYKEFQDFIWGCNNLEPLYQPASYDDVLIYFRG